MKTVNMNQWHNELVFLQRPRLALCSLSVGTRGRN